MLIVILKKLIAIKKLITSQNFLLVLITGWRKPEIDEQFINEPVSSI